VATRIAVVSVATIRDILDSSFQLNGQRIHAGSLSRLTGRPRVTVLAATGLTALFRLSLQQ
jgi:hypothetical protein